MAEATDVNTERIQKAASYMALTWRRDTGDGQPMPRGEKGGPYGQSVVSARRERQNDWKVGYVRR